MTDGQTHGQTKTRVDRQAYRRIKRQRDKQAQRQTHRYRDRNIPRRNLQQAICPYTVMYELSKEQALPIDPKVMRAAVATNITFRPTMSASDPAVGRKKV